MSFMLIVVMLIVVMLSVVMLSVVMLSVVMLSIFMLNVMALADFILELLTKKKNGFVGLRPLLESPL